MSTRRLFVEAQLVTGGTVLLDGERAHYIGRVLRARPGDDIWLFNGDGHEFRAAIERIDRSTVALAVGAMTTPASESPLELRLVQGISKGERMDTVVQKATELGVTRISPVHSEFSVVRLDTARTRTRLKHWQRIAQSACEQCGRTVPPRIDAPQTLADACGASASHAVTRLALAPDAAAPLQTMAPPAARVELLVGPEGGLSDAELELAARTGFTAVSLGPRVLRTETAAIVALALLQARWGDLSGGAQR